MAQILEMPFWPDNRGKGPEGCSPWAIFRIDRKDLKLPDDAELQRLFHEATGPQVGQLTVRSRIQCGCYLFIPKGVSKQKRLAFLDAVEATLSESKAA